jgi:hypothetical protein
MDFVITGNRVGDDQTTPTMRWPIVVQNGASDRYTITGNLVGPNSDPNGRIVDGGTGIHKVIRDNAGQDTIIGIGYSSATLHLYSIAFSVFHLWFGDSATITAIDAVATGSGVMHTGLPNGAYVFQAGNNIQNTITTTANVPFTMTCDEGGKWWFR